MGYGQARKRMSRRQPGRAVVRPIRVDKRAAPEPWLEEATLGRRHADLFPEPTNTRSSLKGLRGDLAEVVVQDGGRVTDVYEKIMADTVLGHRQKQRIFRVLAEVRDSYLRIDGALAAGASNKGYQIVNWKHTRAEIDQVLEAARLWHLSADDTEDALLASIFSDAVKTPQNFITHNIDGAAAAALVLSRYFDVHTPKNAARLRGVVQAAKEHQIGPPAFMATMARAILSGKLGDRAQAHKPQLDSIHKKISRPFDRAQLNEDGSAIAFSREEMALLGEIGVHEWTVPHEGSSHYGVSRAVIDGDSLINYASPDGWAKIAALRGPDTQPFFEDATVFDSLYSAKQSYDDAMSVISEPARPLAKMGLERTRGAVKRMRDGVQRWFATHGPFLPMNADGTIAFWNAPLKYPSAGELTIKEREQHRFAKEIRAKVVELLRAEQGNYT